MSRIKNYEVYGRVFDQKFLAVKTMSGFFFIIDRHQIQDSWPSNVSTSN